VIYNQTFDQLSGISFEIFQRAVVINHIVSHPNFKAHTGTVFAGQMITAINPYGMIKYLSIAHGMKFTFVTQTAIDAVFGKNFPAQASVIIPTIIMNHVIPLCSVVVPIFKALRISCVIVFVFQRRVDELFSTKIRT